MNPCPHARTAEKYKKSEFEEDVCAVWWEIPASKGGSLHNTFVHPVSPTEKRQNGNVATTEEHHSSPVQKSTASALTNGGGGTVAGSQQGNDDGVE